MLKLRNPISYALLIEGLLIIFMYATTIIAVGLLNIDISFGQDLSFGLAYLYLWGITILTAIIWLIFELIIRISNKK